MSWWTPSSYTTKSSRWSPETYAPFWSVTVTVTDWAGRTDSAWGRGGITACWRGRSGERCWDWDGISSTCLPEGAGRCGAGVRAPWGGVGLGPCQPPGWAVSPWAKAPGTPASVRSTTISPPARMSVRMTCPPAHDLKPFSWQAQERGTTARHFVHAFNVPWLLRSTPAQGEDHQRPGDEAAHVCPPGNPTPEASRAGHHAVKQLREEPEGQEHERRHGNDLDEKEDGQQGHHLGAGKQHEVSAHYPSNRAARANHRHLGVWPGQVVQIDGRKSAHQVVEQIAALTQAVLNVVAEDPQRPHVADQVQPTAVQEHGAEHRHEASRQVPGLGLGEPDRYKTVD